MLYFAYGSNMSLSRLSVRVGPVEKLTIGRLSGHSLQFHKQGRDGTGKCDAWRTDAPHDAVYGIIYELAQHQIKLLDQFEDEGKGYLRRPANVVCSRHQIHVAQVYFAQLIDPDLRPFHWYKEHVLSGAREAGLANAYVQTIANTDAIVDADSNRVCQELGISLTP